MKIKVLSLFLLLSITILSCINSNDNDNSKSGKFNNGAMGDFKLHWWSEWKYDERGGGGTVGDLKYIYLNDSNSIPYFRYFAEELHSDTLIPDSIVSMGYFKYLRNDGFSLISIDSFEINEYPFTRIIMKKDEGNSLLYSKIYFCIFKNKIFTLEFRASDDRSIQDDKVDTLFNSIQFQSFPYIIGNGIKFDYIKPNNDSLLLTYWAAKSGYIEVITINSYGDTVINTRNIYKSGMKMNKGANYYRIKISDTDIFLDTNVVSFDNYFKTWDDANPERSLSFQSRKYLQKNE